MGAYLSSPVTEKESHTDSNDRFHYGVSAMQGWRTSMEDAHVAKLSLAGNPEWAFFGVYDGHGGAQVARFCSLHMADELTNNLDFQSGNVGPALKQTYLAVDDRLRLKENAALLKQLRADNNDDPNDEGGGRNSRDPASADKEEGTGSGSDDGYPSVYIPGIGKIMIMPRDAEGGEEGGEDGDDDNYEGPSAGCTAVVAVVVGQKLYVANAGDSRCVLCRGKDTISLTQDHKPTDPEEDRRIRAAGGWVTEGRVNGSLNLSRAIGDMNYKQLKSRPAEEQIVTANPDIREIDLTPEDRFLILACDGIWDILTNEEAVQFVDEKLAEGLAPKEICEMMCDRCLANSTEGIGKGCDNMSAMVVLLNQSKQ